MEIYSISKELITPCKCDKLGGKENFPYSVHYWRCRIDKPGLKYEKFMNSIRLIQYIFRNWISNSSNKIIEY